MNDSGYEPKIRKELFKNVEDALNVRILENGKTNVLTFKKYQLQKQIKKKSKSTQR